MTYSMFDSFYELKPDHYIVSSIRQNTTRTNGKKGELGFLILEMLDTHFNHVIYKINFPFGIKNQIQTSKITAEEQKNWGIFYSQSYSISKDQFDSSELNTIITTSSSQNLDLNESSYKKARKALTNYFGITPAPSGDPQILILPEFKIKDPTIHWNPFNKLVENNKFPFARLQYSNIWQRIKDTFYIFNGSTYLKNNLGLLDYIFPIPRLLVNLMTMDISLLAKIIIAPFAVSSLAIKIIAATLISFLLTPIIGITHLACKLLFPTYDELDETIEVSPIKGELESVSDLQYNQDLSEPIKLSSYHTMSKSLTIKPLAIGQNAHCEELNSQRLLNSSENLLLAVYADDTPKAIIEINETNKPGIFNLMKKNKYKIDTHLDEANVTVNFNSICD